MSRWWTANVKVNLIKKHHSNPLRVFTLKSRSSRSFTEIHYLHSAESDNWRLFSLTYKDGKVFNLQGQLNGTKSNNEVVTLHEKQSLLGVQAQLVFQQVPKDLPMTTKCWKWYKLTYSFLIKKIILFLLNSCVHFE